MERSGVDEAVFELVAQIDTQIAAQEDKIRSAQEVLSKLRNARLSLGELPESRAAGPRPRTSGAPGAEAKEGRRHREGSAAHTVLTVARQAIREAGRPLNRVEIVNAIEASGRELRTKKPLEYVNKVMWDSAEFCRADGGYFFADQPLPDRAKHAKSSRSNS